MEAISKYKAELEKIDKAFETKYKNYDPYIKFMKFYIRFKDGKIKRYGATNFYRSSSFYSQNVDFKLYSKNVGDYELKKIIFSSLSYVSEYWGRSYLSKLSLFYCIEVGWGRGTGNTNFGEHWSKSPGDERAVVSSARRRPRKTGSRHLSARRGFRRACDGSTKFCG